MGEFDVNIDSFNSALEFLEGQPLSGDFTSVSLTGDMEKLEIRIYGESYHGEFTGELARGVALFQDELYRATLNILNSLGSEQARLTSAQKELLALKVEVFDNCTLFSFDFGEWSKGLIEVLKNMPPKVAAVVVVVVACAAIGGCVAVDLGGKYFEVQKSTTSVQEETKRHEVHAKNMDRLIAAYAARVQEDSRVVAASELVAASQNGVREIAVRAVDARAVDVGAVRLDEEALAELRKRSPRTSPDKKDITESYKIIRFTKGAPATLVLNGRSYGEFSANIDESEFSGEKVDALYAAFRADMQITLSVALLVANGKIKSASVVDIDVPSTKTAVNN